MPGMGLLGFIVLVLALGMILGLVAGWIDRANPRHSAWWGLALVCVVLLVLIMLFAKGGANGASALLYLG